MKKLLPLFVFFAFLFGVQHTAWAQRRIEGTVKGVLDQQPVVGAHITIKGKVTGTITDLDGKFALTLLPDDNTLIVSFVGFKTQELNVTNQTQIEVFMSDGMELENIVVVGSRNATRTKLESPVPIDVLPIAAIVNEVGQIDISQLLNYAVPQFQSNRQTISDGTDHVDPAQLRGLGPDQVLVLINGKRRHTSSLVNVNGTVGRGNVGTDLSAIPPSSIERIEILRDGAAAQYGSDAIAGIINVVLKNYTDRLEGNLLYGICKAGDGETWQANANYGFRLGRNGYMNIGADFVDRGYTNRMERYTGPIYYPSSDANQEEKDDSILVARGLTRSDFNMIIGNSAIRNGSFMFNGAYPLSDNAELYTFGGANYRNGMSAGFYRMPIQTDRVIAEIYPNGFLPEIHSTIVDRSIGAGLRGSVKNWNIDFSNTFGNNSFDFRVENSNNASMGLASPTSFRCGGFKFSQNTTNLDFSRLYQHIFRGLNVAMGAEFRVENYQIYKGEEASYKNYGLYTVFDLDTTATGVIYQDYSATVDVLKKAGGAQVFPGFRPENELSRYRSNGALYADLEADLTKWWLLSGAVRYENYSDFGQTTNYKVATRIKFSENYSLRGSASTGFRAPSLQQRYFNSTSTQFINGEPFEIGNFTNDSRVAQILGIPALRQERSKNLSIGLTARPARDVAISLDAYQIDITDRILLTGQFGGSDAAISALLQPANANAAAFFVNAVDTRTRGVDLVISYEAVFNPTHKLRFSLAANYNKTQTVGDIKTTPLLEGKEDIYFNRENRSLLETGTPIAKGTFTVNYNIKKFNLMVRNVYFGEVTYLHPLDGDPNNWVLNEYTDKIETRDQTFGGKTVTDVTAGWQINSVWNVSVGASNVFDVYPDKQSHSNNVSFGRFEYSRRVQQFGFNGAYYFARLGFLLK